MLVCCARSCSLMFSRVGIMSGNPARDRKSTRLNSSHGYISYAVFCLKKKKHRVHAVIDRHVLADALLVRVPRLDLPERLQLHQRQRVGPVAVDLVGGSVHVWLLASVV